ncbi:hypothetical protein Vafri_12844 [Volvox africanus]|uniref:Cyclic nucleotide-binding domain-containing protein n=1 Tax=Volvox africanus TaxID=51714 RepID=A0A8J4F330_9CHLO|nr:hypothetical protein Vafri_12844 [Volvox africanus]
MAEASALFLLSNYIEKNEWHDAENNRAYALDGDVGIHGSHNDADSEPRIVHTRTGELGTSNAGVSPCILGHNGDFWCGREFHRRLTASKSRAAWLQLLQKPGSTERFPSAGTSTGIPGDMSFASVSRTASHPSLAQTTMQVHVHPASQSGLYHAHQQHVILPGWVPANLPRVGSRPGLAPQPQYGITQDTVLEPAGTSMATAASIQDFLMRTTPSELHPSAAQVALPNSQTQKHLPIDGGASSVPTISPPSGQLQYSLENLWRVPPCSSHLQAGRRLLRRFATVSERSYGSTTDMKCTKGVEESGAATSSADGKGAASGPEGTVTAGVVDAGAEPSMYHPPRSGDTSVDVSRPGSRGLRPSTSLPGRGGVRPMAMMPPLPGLLGSSTSLSSSLTRMMSHTDHNARPYAQPLLPPHPRGALEGGANPSDATGNRCGSGWMGMYLGSTASETDPGNGASGDMVLQPRSWSLRQRRRCVQGLDGDANMGTGAMDSYGSSDAAAAATLTAAAVTPFIRKVGISHNSAAGSGAGRTGSCRDRNPPSWLQVWVARKGASGRWEEDVHRSRAWKCVGSVPRASGFGSWLLALLSADPWELMDKFLPVLMPSPWRTAWDAVLLVLLMFTAVVVPLEVGFPSAASTGLDKSHIAVLIVFWIDIVVQFRTAFVSSGGELVRGSRQIAAHYCRTWFFLDLGSSIPWAEVLQAVLSGQGNSLAGQLVALARLPRLLRLLRVLRLMDRLRYANLLRIVRLMVLLMLIAHWTACAWHGMAEWIKSWPWIFSELLVSDSLLLHYSVALYYSYVLVIGSDNPSMQAENNVERVFMIVMLVTGSLLSALVVSHMAMLVVNYNSLSSRYLTKAALASDALRYMGAPEEHQVRVADYYDFLIENDHPGPEADSVLHELPRGLLEDIKWSLYSTALTKLPLFAGCDEPFMAALQSRLTLSAYTSREVIFRALDAGRDMFIVRQGCVLLMSLLGEVSALLRPGDMFGELALLPVLGARRRTHTAIALGSTDVILLTARDLAAVCKDHPESGEVVKERLLLRYEQLLNGGGQMGLYDDPSLWLYTASTHYDLDSELEQRASELTIREPAAAAGSMSRSSVAVITNSSEDTAAPMVTASPLGMLHDKDNDAGDDATDPTAIFDAFGDSTEVLSCRKDGSVSSYGGVDTQTIPSRMSSSSSWTSFLEAANSYTSFLIPPRVPPSSSGAAVAAAAVITTAEEAGSFRGSFGCVPRSQTAAAAAGRPKSAVRRSLSKRRSAVADSSDTLPVGGGRIGEGPAVAAVIGRTKDLETMQLDTVSITGSLDASSLHAVASSTCSGATASISTGGAAAVPTLAASSRRSVSLRRRGEGSSRLANASGPVVEVCATSPSVAVGQLAFGIDASECKQELLDTHESDRIGDGGDGTAPAVSAATSTSPPHGSSRTATEPRAQHGRPGTAAVMVRVQTFLGPACEAYAAEEETYIPGSVTADTLTSEFKSGSQRMAGSTSADEQKSPAHLSLPPPPPAAPPPPPPSPAPPATLQYALSIACDGAAGSGSGAAGSGSLKQPLPSPFRLQMANGAAADSEDGEPPELVSVRPPRRSLLGLASLLRRFNAGVDEAATPSAAPAPAAGAGGHYGGGIGVNGFQPFTGIPVNFNGAAVTTTASSVSHGAPGGPDAPRVEERSEVAAGSGGGGGAATGSRRLQRHTSGGLSRGTASSYRTGSASRHTRGSREAGGGGGLSDPFMSTAPAWLIARASRDHGHRRHILTDDMVGRALQMLALVVNGERDAVTHGSDYLIFSGGSGHGDHMLTPAPSLPSAQLSQAYASANSPPRGAASGSGGDSGSGSGPRPVTSAGAGNGSSDRIGTPGEGATPSLPPPPLPLSAGHMGMLLGILDSVVRRYGVDALPVVRDAVRTRVRHVEELLATELQSALGSLMQIEKEMVVLDDSAAAAKRRLAAIEEAAAEASGDGVLVPNLMGLLDTESGLNLVTDRLQQAAASGSSFVSEPLLPSALQSLGSLGRSATQQLPLAATGSRHNSILHHYSHSSTLSDVSWVPTATDRALSPSTSEKRVLRRSSLNVRSVSLSGQALEAKQSASAAAAVSNGPVRQNTGSLTSQARRRSVDNSSQMMGQLRRNDFSALMDVRRAPNVAGADDGSETEHWGSGSVVRRASTCRGRFTVSTSGAILPGVEVATAAARAAPGDGAAAAIASQADDLEASPYVQPPETTDDAGRRRPAVAASVGSQKAKRLSLAGQPGVNGPPCPMPRASTAAQVIVSLPRQRGGGGAARNILDDSVVCDTVGAAAGRPPQPTLLPSERPGARRSPGRNSEFSSAASIAATAALPLLERSVSSNGGPHKMVLRRGSTSTLHLQLTVLGSQQGAAGGGSGTQMQHPQQQQQPSQGGRTAASRAAAAAAVAADVDAIRVAGSGGSQGIGPPSRLRSGSDLPGSGSGCGGGEDVSVRSGLRVREDASVRAGRQMAEDVSVRSGRRVREDASVRAGRQMAEDVSVRSGRRVREDASVRAGRQMAEDVSVRSGRRVREDASVRAGRQMAEDVSMRAPCKQ